MLIENTIVELLNKKLQLFDLNDLEKDFSNLYGKIFSDKIKLITEHDFKLHIVKAGLLNLTFERETMNSDKYLRVLMETSDAGPQFFVKLLNRGKDHDDFVRNWKTTYYQLQKPLEFVIVDACYTNFPSVWNEKYFYS